MIDLSDNIISRDTRPDNHRLSLLADCYVERGDKDDWDLLAELHYKAERLGIGPKIWRCRLYGQTIGVGVMTVPKMLLSGRNRVFTHMKPNQDGRDSRIINTHRAKVMNAVTCTNSRLVLDTMFRGAGIAYRMQNIMMRMTACRTIEFQSSMSKFNPFAEKAGMQFTRLERAQHYEKGLQWFRRWFECNPSDYVGLFEELSNMPERAKEKCISEMRALYYKCSSMEKSGDNRANGTDRVEGMSVPYLIKSLQQLILASPLYGVYMNPDFGIELPKSIPVLAYDLQPTTAPLDIPGALELSSRISATEH